MSDDSKIRKYRDSYRGYLIDHHSPDPPLQPLDRLDIAEWEAGLQRAHLNCMLVYCKDHYGVTYYDTQVGRKHPGLRGDWIAQVAEMLKRNGAEFWAYYSLGFDLWATQQHPDWACRNEDGSVMRYTELTPKWPFACGNTPYRDYMIAQLGEILAYEPDSVFLDIPQTPFCWCETCLRLFRERYGFEMPRGEEKHAQWRTMVDWYQEVLQFDLFKTLTDAIHQLDPRVPVTFNGCQLHNSARVCDLMDWTYAEPWAGNFVSAGFARGLGTDAQIGPGHLSEVYNPYPPSVYEAEIAGIAAQGVRPFLFSGSLKPDGSLDRLELDEIGAAFGEVEKFEPLLKNRDAIREVGLFFSEQTRLYGLDHPRLREDMLGCLMDQSYNEPMAGAVNAAAVAKVPWEVLPEWKLSAEELAAYRVLVLPNANALSDAQAALIADWVRAGGALLSTFRTSLLNETGHPRANFALAEVLGVDYVGMNERYAGGQTYGSYLDDRVGPLWEALPDTSLGVAPPLVEVRPATAEVLATHTLPACRVTSETWVNWWSPPPATPTPFPAVTLNRYGAGLAMYASFDLFYMLRRSFAHPFQWPWLFLAAALDKVLLPEPRLQVVTPQPRSLHATFFRVRGKDQVLVHLLNGTVLPLNGDVLPIPAGSRLVIRDAGFPPASARIVYPVEQPLELRTEGAAQVIDLPEVAIHTIISLEGKP